MKTYLCIADEDQKGSDPLFLETGMYQSFLPQIGDRITVHVSSSGPAARPPGWETKGEYEVISRRYEVYNKELEDLEMNCELTVRKMS